jgi:glycosyltransferase involved in cell wall biosynthesis/LmbE family N-acetylglucosaminyl deacetylase
MVDRPLVSVLMAAYNAQPYVREAIESVLAQTYPDFELIVMDDGSTDATRDVVRGFSDSRLRLVSRPHRGLAACRNELLELATGEYVAVLDADDTAMPDRLEHQARFLDENPEVGAVGGWVEFFGLETRVDRRPENDADIRKMLRLSTAVADGAMTARRRLLLGIGGYDETALWVDWEINLRIAATSKLHNLPEVVIRYRVHPGSMQKAIPRVERRREKMRRRLQAARILGWRPHSFGYLLTTRAAILLYGFIDRRTPSGLPPVRTASVVVPSRGRPEMLERCLQGVIGQTRPPDEIVVVVPHDDDRSTGLLETWAAAGEGRRVLRSEIGQVHALSKGVAAASGDVVCFIDDDAVPHPEWLKELIDAYGPKIAGTGGRVRDIRDGRAVEGRTRRVGRVTWYGKAVGRHHLDARRQQCDWLTGGNSSYRRSFVNLWSELIPNAHGVQFANDVAMGMAAAASGHKLEFVRSAVIDHFSVSPREPATGMRTVGPADVEAAAHNILFAVCRGRNLPGRLVAYSYWFAAGTTTAPGPLRAAAGLLAGRGDLVRRVAPAYRGKKKALRTLRSVRSKWPPQLIPAESALAGRIAVLSPHLDDAVLSLGAAIAGAAANGSEIKVVTVLGGNPASDAPAGSWDASARFRTWGEAVRGRRQEDLRACELVGAQPVWLSFGDHQYNRGAGDDEIWEAIEGATSDVDAVLVPGWPLSHPDHSWLTRLVLDRSPSARRVGLFVEQPYVTITRHLSRPGTAEGLRSLLAAQPEWSALTVAHEHRRQKRKAVQAYRSQLRLITLRPFLPWRMTRYERSRGGEWVAWISRENVMR